MRVLMLTSSTGFYGAENVVIELLSELKKKGIKVYFGIFENSSNAHFTIAEKVKQYISDVTVFPCNGKVDIRTILLLRRFIDKNDIDIIHSHKYKTNLYSLLASISTKSLLIATCHNWLSDNINMRLYEWLDKKVLKKFDKVIVVSDEVKEKIIKSGLHSSKVLKIGNGISIEKYSTQSEREKIRTEFGISSERIVIGSVGRLDRNKGVIYLLKAAKALLKEYKSICLLIVGDGPSKQDLYDEALELGIGNNVIFTGFRNDISSIFSAFDIFVLPSLKEGLPMVLLEAMASRIPVIATRVGDIPIVIKHKETGLLINTENTIELENAVKLLIKDKNLATLMAEQAFNKVINEYSSESMATNYIKVYKSILHQYHLQ